VIAALNSGPVQVSGILANSSYVALTIARFVCMEVIERPLTMSGQRSVVPETGIKAVVNVSVKTTRTVKPGTGSDEESADKPVGAIIAIGSTVIGWIVEVPVRTYRGYSNANYDLRLRHSSSKKEDCGNCRNYERLKPEHKVLLSLLVRTPDRVPSCAQFKSILKP
jgi:hypothetical protein